MPVSKNKKKVQIDEQEALANQFIMEVDEDLKQESISKLWKKLSWVIACVCIAIIAVVSYVQYQKNQNKKLADRDSHLYQQAIKFQESADTTQALTKLNEIIKNNGKYKVIASMTKAQILSESDTQKAFDTYLSVFKDSKTPDIYKNMALTHAGYISVTDPKLFTKVKNDITSLSKTTNKFKYLALEILAWESITIKDYSSAKRYLNILQADIKAPSGMKTRSKIILESLNSDIAPVKNKAKTQTNTKTKTKPKSVKKTSK